MVITDWHDWYLSSNLNRQNNLNNHLMKNVPITGVPNALKNTVLPLIIMILMHLKTLSQNIK